MVWIPDLPRTLNLVWKIQGGANVVADASDLFWEFFDRAYPTAEEFHERMERLRAESIIHEVTDSKEVAELVAMRDDDYAAEYVVRAFEELREGYDLPYAPDGVGDDEEALIAAVHIHAIHLVRTYRLHDSLLNEDVRDAVRKLTSLRERLRNLRGRINPIDECDDVLGPDLALARADVEIAAADGEYERALRLMADNLPKELFGEIQLGANAPDKDRWTFDGIGQRIVNWINALRGKRGVDWDAIIEMFNQFALGSMHGGEIVTDDVGFSGMLIDYDLMLKAWSEVSLSEAEYRSIIEGREVFDAERRLQVYYFGDGLWQTLPNRARAALVNADRAFVSGGAGRTAAILNELRIAAEELLHDRLWKPLIAWAWADEQEEYRKSADFSKLRSIREELRAESPGLGTYERLLRKNAAVDRFLQEQAGVDEPGLRFIKRQAAERLERLRQARNAAEHNPSHEANLAKIRDLYAEAVGIGRKGVLPELARLLGKRRA